MKNLKWIFVSIVGLLMSSLPAMAWQQITNKGITKIAAADDGYIYGLQIDGHIYRARAHQPWTKITVNGGVTNFSVASNGDIYGVGGDGAIYKTNPGKPWEYYLYGVGKMTKVVGTADGTVYAISSDDKRVYQGNPIKGWSPLFAVPRNIIDIAALDDGNVYGISQGGELVLYDLKEGKRVDWPKPGDYVLKVAVTNRKDFYGIGSDCALWSTQKDEHWRKVANRCITEVAVTNTGMMYGLGTDGAVYAQAAPVTPAPAKFTSEISIGLTSYPIQEEIQVKVTNIGEKSLVSGTSGSTMTLYISNLTRPKMPDGISDRRPAEAQAFVGFPGPNRSEIAHTFDAKTIGDVGLRDCRAGEVLQLQVKYYQKNLAGCLVTTPDCYNPQFAWYHYIDTEVMDYICQ